MKSVKLGERENKDFVGNGDRWRQMNINRLGLVHGWVPSSDAAVESAPAATLIVDLGARDACNFVWL